MLRSKNNIMPKNNLISNLKTPFFLSITCAVVVVFFCEPSVATNRAAKLSDFSGVNIEDSFRKALFLDMPVKKVSAQFQNTRRTRNWSGPKIIKWNPPTNVENTLYLFGFLFPRARSVHNIGRRILLNDFVCVLFRSLCYFGHNIFHGTIYIYIYIYIYWQLLWSLLNI